MSLGIAPANEDLYRSTRELCAPKLSATSIYRLLAEEGHRLFGDEVFADLFDDVGRRSVPARVVATVMVLQRLEGASDREAVDRFAFDLRWKYAAGVSLDYPGFVHTVLVDMRERLRGSERPNRIFEAALEMAKGAGLVGRKRVLDSTALYDAVATQDTVTMIRAAIRGVLREAGELGAELRQALTRDDSYENVGKPVCDWSDEAAREALVDALATDGYALLWLLDGKTLGEPVRQAALLLATVLGQDLEQSEDGLFRIARRVAKDRVISTVDPEARHGHKTTARGFDGYKGHIAVDPDSEIITATGVTAGNAGDASEAEALLRDVLPPRGPIAPSNEQSPTEPPPPRSTATRPMALRTSSRKCKLPGCNPYLKVQLPAPPHAGMFSLEDFKIDLQAGTATCPRGILVTLRTTPDGSRVGDFRGRCADCPLRPRCTHSKQGRTICLHPKYAVLEDARARQKDKGWLARYRGIRPKVERKIAHLTRRRHGGRRVRMRGRLRIGHDFALLAAAINLARLASLGI